MATPAAETLTAAYTRAQTATALKAAVAARLLWTSRVKPASLATTTAAYVEELLPILLRFRAESEERAKPYYGALRRLDAPGAPPFELPEIAQLDEEYLRRSLNAVGPAALFDWRDRQVALGNPVTDAMVREKINAMSEIVAGSALRHTANGGRAAIDQTRKADPVALGYYRQTKDDPCYFCAMLASRGVVYKEDSFDESDARFEGDGRAKVHDHCVCFNRPVYMRNIELPDSTKKAETAWSELTGRDRKGDPIPPALEFRRRWEGRY